MEKCTPSNMLASRWILSGEAKRNFEKESLAVRFSLKMFRCCLQSAAWFPLVTDHQVLRLALTKKSSCRTCKMVRHISGTTCWNCLSEWKFQAACWLLIPAAIQYPETFRTLSFYERGREVYNSKTANGLWHPIDPDEIPAVHVVRLHTVQKMNATSDYFCNVCRTAP